MNFIVFHACVYIFFAGVSSFLSFKKLFRFSDSASFVASLFWTFNPVFVAYYYDQVINPVCIWIPIFLVCLIYFEERPRLYFLFLVLGSCEMLLSCRFDSIEISVMTLALVLVLHHTLNYKTRDFLIKWLISRLKITFWVSTIAACIMCPLLVEQYNIISESHRSALTVQPLVYAFSFFNFFSIVPISQEFFSFLRGNNILGYVGPIFLFLLIMGLLGGARRREACIFLLAALFVSLFTYDVNFFGASLFDLYRLLPGHGSLRYSQRFLPAYFFLLCVPLMSGWDALMIQGKSLNNRSIFKILALGFTVFIATLLVALLANDGSQILAWNRPSMLAVILLADLLVLLALLFFITCKISKNWVLTSAVLFCIFKSYIISYLYVPESPMHTYQQIQNNAQFQKVADVLRARESDYFNYRVLDIRDSLDISQYLIAQGFHLLAGYHPLASWDFAAFIEVDLNSTFYNTVTLRNVLNPHAFGLANVKYFLAPKQNRLAENPTLKRLLVPLEMPPDSDDIIYENQAVLPRAYLVHEFKTSKPGVEFLDIAELLGRNPDWFKQGVVLSTCAHCTPATLENAVSEVPLASQDQVQIKSYKNDAVKIQTNSSRSSFLVFTDKFDPNHWEAKVDGQLVEMIPANGIFRAVKLDKGAHEVEFTYIHQYWAWRITAFGVLILLMFQLTPMVLLNKVS